MDNNKNPDYSPSPGNNMWQKPDQDDGRPNPTMRSYADFKELDNLLDRLLIESTKLIEVCEKDLGKYVLQISEDNQKLSSAFEAESQVYDIETSYVPYMYYKLLKRRESTNASLLTHEYDKGARDINGTSSIDIIKLAAIMRDEANAIKEFVDNYVDDLNDSSEQRIVELFQDWTSTAINYTRKFRTFLKEAETTFRMPQEDFEAITSSEAKRGQALFKVKFNASNTFVVRNIEQLYQSFRKMGDVYFQNNLGPAIQFRSRITRRILPIGESVVVKELRDASRTMDSNLESVISDQSRRNLMFSTKIHELYTDLQERERYRILINQLSQIGKEVPETQFSRYDIPSDELEKWNSVVEEITVEMEQALLKPGKSIRPSGVHISQIKGYSSTSGVTLYDVDLEWKSDKESIHDIEITKLS